MRLLMEVRNLMENYQVKSGIYHYFRNEFSQAEAFLTRALRDEESLGEADARNARHYLTLSLMDAATRLEADGRPDEAVERLGRAAAMSSGYPDIHHRTGVVLERMGRLDEAIEAYGRAIDLYEDYLEARVSLGFCLLRSGRNEDAAETLQRALELKKKQLETRVAAGMDHLESGEVEDAEQRFHEAFRAAPQLCDEYLAKAKRLLRDEDPEGALENLDLAILLGPKYPDVRNLRGVVLYDLGRIIEAVEEFGIAVEAGPGFLAPRLNRAFALARAEELEAAERELRSILEQHPTETAAKAKLEELTAPRTPEKRRPVSRGSSA